MFKGRRYRCVERLPADRYPDALDAEHGDDAYRKLIAFIEGALLPDDFERFSAEARLIADLAELQRLGKQLAAMFAFQIVGAGMNRKERRAAKRRGLT